MLLAYSFAGAFGLGFGPAAGATSALLRSDCGTALAHAYSGNAVAGALVLAALGVAAPLAWVGLDLLDLDGGSFRSLTLCPPRHLSFL